MRQYRLAEGVTLEEDKDGGILSIQYPRRIIRLSNNGVQALNQVCGQGIGFGEGDHKLAAFADDLENKGILIREFPGLPGEYIPFVSLIIPTYNRGKMLVSCVETLLVLDYPKEKLEIIVVDDASPISVDLVSYKPLVRVIRLDQNSGPGAARNIAVKEAQGEIIAFLDDDCLADKDWLKTLVACFHNTEIAAVGVRVESASLSRPLDKYEQVQSPLLMGDSQRKVRKGGSLSYLATCNLLVRKKSLVDLGGFDPLLRVGEDVDLCWRLLAKGEQIYYFPGGVVYHHHRSGLIQFLKRRYNYGQSEAKLQKRYPDERRRLVYFEGNLVIIALVAAMFFVTGLLQAFLTGLGLTLLNLIWHSLRKNKSVKLLNSKPINSKLINSKSRFWSILLAMLRSQGIAIYYYCQHFARYYSLPALIVALIGIPRLVPIFLSIHLLSSIINYKIKKPLLGAGNFIFYNFLENFSYQIGVYSGCIKESCWKPLTMSFIRADS